MRHARESCLLGGDFWISSWEQMQLQPPSRLAIMWANPSSPAAPNPSLKACSLGSLHSNIHSRSCLTCTQKLNKIATSLSQKTEQISDKTKPSLCNFVSLPCSVQFRLRCRVGRPQYPWPPPAGKSTLQQPSSQRKQSLEWKQKGGWRENKSRDWEILLWGLPKKLLYTHTAKL